MSWKQVPQRTAVQQPILPPLLLVTLPLTVFVLRLEQPLWWVVIIGGASAVAVTIGRARPGHWPLIAAAAGATMGLVLAPHGGTAVRLAVYAAASLALWPVGMGVVRWRSDRLHGGRALQPALIPLAVGSLLLVLGGTLWAPLALAAAATILAVVGVAMPSGSAAGAARLHASGALRRLARGVDAVAAAIGKSVSALAMLPALAVICVLWLVHRLTGSDILAGSHDHGTTWVVRTGEDPGRDRFFSAAPTVDAAPFRQRVSRSLAKAVPLLTLCIVAAMIFLPSRDDDPTGAPPASGHGSGTSAEGGSSPDSGPVERSGCDPQPPIPLAVDDPETWQGLLCEMTSAGSSSYFYAPGVYRLSDFAGDHLTIKDGFRSTMTPPPCDCETLDVWLFGGSTAWGWLQSDNDSLASMISRLGGDRGRRLEVLNAAMPGYASGQEVRTFADLLASRPAPDIAIFLSGGNDLVLQVERYFSGSIDDESDVVLMESAFDDLLAMGPLNQDPGSTQFNTQLLPSDPPDELIAEVPRAAFHAMARLGRNVELAKQLGASYDVPILFALQPLFDGADPQLGDTDQFSPSSQRMLASLGTAGRQSAPPGVVDLGDIYDDVDAPVFLDQFHINRLGSTIVAQALLDEIEALVYS